MGDLLGELILAGFGALLTVNGLTFRLATPMWARWIATYKRGGHSRLQRHGPLVNAPLGLALLSAALALAVSSPPWRGLLWGSAALCACGGALMWSHAPSWAQPPWMRREVE